MPVYKCKNKKGWYFSTYLNGKLYKREVYNGRDMLTKTEAQACEYSFRQELLKQLQLASMPEITRITMESAFLSFWEDKKLVLKDSTAYKYGVFLKNDLPCKNKILSEVTVFDIDSWKAELKASTNAAATKNKKLGLLNEFLEWCNIHYDMTNKVRIPLQTKFKDNSEPAKVNVYTYDEFKLFDSVIDNEFYKCLFNVLYFTGLRIGELSALLVTDYVDDSLVINKDLVRINGVDIVQPPKTKNSYRTVRLDASTSELVKKLIGSRASGYIFGDKNPVSQQRMREHAKAYALKAGLPALKIHEFRKSHATYLKDLGFDAYSIAARLGNTPEMSNDIYIQAHEFNQVEIINKINKKD